MVSGQFRLRNCCRKRRRWAIRWKHDWCSAWPVWRSPCNYVVSTFLFLPLIFAALVLCLVTEPAATQEVGLVTVDVKDVAKGYRANSLELKPVMNDKGELIGTIDDFMFGRDDGVFVILAVGDFVGLGGNLVAVPFKSLKFDDPNGSVVLPGASQAALRKLPVFFYNR